MNFPKTKPKTKDRKISKNNKTKNRKSIEEPFIIFLEIAKVTANNIMTRTSFTTVTPIVVFVKGPLALISFITAIAEEGERATKIVPNKMATAHLSREDKEDMKFMLSDIKNINKELKTKVTNNCETVIHFILFNLDLSSFK